MKEEKNEEEKALVRSDKHKAAREHLSKPHHVKANTPEQSSSHSRGGARQAKAAAQRAAAQKKTIYKISAVLVLIVVVAAAALTFTSTNMFCGACHEMGPDYSSWEESTHRDVKCVSCHIGPGFFNLIVHKMASMKSLYYHFAGGYENPINEDGGYAEELRDEYCLQCHEEILTVKKIRADAKTDIKPAHDKHRSLGHMCSSCHNRVAHNIKGYEDNSKMSACQKCHSNAGSGSNCGLCHSSKFLLENNRK